MSELNQSCKSFILCEITLKILISSHDILVLRLVLWIEMYINHDEYPFPMQTSLLAIHVHEILLNYHKENLTKGRTVRQNARS